MTAYVTGIARIDVRFFLRSHVDVVWLSASVRDKNSVTIYLDSLVGGK